MKAYKGFDKDLKCRGFQYEVGKEYEEGSAKLCKKGFHACENPLDTFCYYGPTDSRYCEVDVDDNGERNSGDSKVCGKHIKIGAEIGLKGVINAGVRFVFDKCESATEENASGLRGNAAASAAWTNIKVFLHIFAQKSLLTFRTFGIQPFRNIGSIIGSLFFFFGLTEQIFNDI